MKISEIDSIINEELFCNNKTVLRTVYSTISTICSSVFYRCFTLQTVSFPNATTIGSEAFYSCTSLQAANFPNVTTIGSSAFYSCYALQTVSFPNATTIGSHAFAYCSALKSANFPNATTIGTSAFYNCSKLMLLYIGTSNCVLSNFSVFLNTPMSNSTYTGDFGSIYVPAAYVNTYKAATNWSKYAARIVGY